MKLYGKRQPLQDPLDKASQSTAQAETKGNQTSDPRLWIYRYTEPPCNPILVPSTQITDSEIPLHEEGTVLRITGRISINPRSGERQIEAMSLIPITVEEEKYAEWHHATRCKQSRENLYKNKQKVRDLLDLDGDRMQAAAETTVEILGNLTTRVSSF